MEVTNHLAADEVRWHYDNKAPRNTKLWLLTVGEVCVTGNYTDDNRFLAWSPMLKIDKAALEARRREMFFGNPHVHEVFQDALNIMGGVR